MSYCLPYLNIIHIEVLSILGYNIILELLRNKIENTYNAIFVRDNYVNRQKNSSHFGKYNEFLSNLISEKLHENWFPE